MVTERDDLTADGLRCATCSMRSEIEGHERNIADESARKQQRRLHRRVKRISVANTVVWLCTADVVCRGESGWLYALWGVAFAVCVALFWRQRWALYLALGLDGATIAGAFGLALFQRTAQLSGALLLSVFPLIFGLLLYSLRRAFTPSGASSPPVEKPKPKWSAPGRQF